MRTKLRGPIGVLLPCLLAIAGCHYGLEGGGEPKSVSGAVSLPKLLSGQPLDLGSSGCELPVATVFIVRVFIRSDGTTSEPEFTKGEPSDCIASFVAATIATWVFEPPMLDGEPVGVYYLRSINTPR
jgi:hypothetical protein